MAFTSNYVTCAGREIHFTEWGAGHGPTVVAWHGLARTGRDMDELAAALSDRFRVICPDMVGRGFSQWSPDPGSEYSTAFYARVAAELFDRLGIERAHWVGTSMGGAIGTACAGGLLQPRMPARVLSLVLNDNAPRLADAAIERIRDYAGQPPAFATVTELEAFFRQVYKPYGWLSDAQWRRLTETSTRRLPDGRVTPHYDPAMARQLADRPDDYLLWEHYDRIRVPVLLLRGAESDLVLPETAAEMMTRGPGALGLLRIVEVPGCGHAPALNVPDAEARDTPRRGTVWLDERLTAALGAKVGDVVQLGSARLAVSAVLTLEPDRGVNFFNIAPRLMMHADDLPATQLIQVGSRVTWRLHLAGEAKAVAAYQKWAEKRLGRGERIENLENARPEVRNALDRAEKFLRLAALLAAVLAAVAVGLAARRFMQRHLDGCAVMRCLGARESQLLRIYLGEFLLFGAIASALGCLAGFGAQFALERLLANLLTAELPPPSPLPLAYGFAVGLALLAGFALPQLARLRNVPTVRVLRREWAEAEPLAWTGYAFGAAVLAGLMLWMAADIKLGLWVLGLFSLAVALYAVVARLSLAAAGRLRGAAGAGWRYGIASLARRLGTSVIQAVALGLGMTALLLLTLARDDLLASWKRSVPPDAPNRFIINIQPEQREPVRELFAAKGLEKPTLLPMVRGRLVAVNGRRSSRPTTPRNAPSAWSSASSTCRGRRNCEGNSLTAGRWFAAGTPAGRSSRWRRGWPIRSSSK